MTVYFNTCCVSPSSRQACLCLTFRTTVKSYGIKAYDVQVYKIFDRSEWKQRTNGHWPLNSCYSQCCIITVLLCCTFFSSRLTLNLELVDWISGQDGFRFNEDNVSGLPSERSSSLVAALVGFQKKIRYNHSGLLQAECLGGVMY